LFSSSRLVATAPSGCDGTSLADLYTDPLDGEIATKAFRLGELVKRTKAPAANCQCRSNEPPHPIRRRLIASDRTSTVRPPDLAAGLDPGGVTDQSAPPGSTQRALGAAAGAVYGSHDRRVAVPQGVNSARLGSRPGRWLVMSAVTEHLEQRGSAFELLPHRQAYNHVMVVFAAGTQTESVRIRTRERLASGQATAVPLVKQADWGSDDLIRQGERPTRSRQAAGIQRRNRLRRGDLPPVPAVCPTTVVAAWQEGRAQP
jgi:hypothetical protein